LCEEVKTIKGGQGGIKRQLKRKSLGDPGTSAKKGGKGKLEWGVEKTTEFPGANLQRRECNTQVISKFGGRVCKSLIGNNPRELGKK